MFMDFMLLKDKFTNPHNYLVNYVNISDAYSTTKSLNSLVVAKPLCKSGKFMYNSIRYKLPYCHPYGDVLIVLAFVYHFTVSRFSQ